MKKYIKIAIILLTSGLVLFLIGFTTNGFSMPKSNETVNGKITQNYTRKINRFNAISLNSNIPVNIKSSNDSKISVSLNKVQKVHFNVDNGVLSLNGSSNKWYHNFFRVGFLNNYNRKDNTSITIFVPRDRKLKYINQSGQYGNVDLYDLDVNSPIKLESSSNIDNVKAPSINVDSSDNDLYIKNSTFNKEKSYLSNSDGDVYIHNNNFNSFNASDSDGDMYINNNKVYRGISHIENSDGNINLGENSWDKLSLSNSDGDINFDHQDINSRFISDVSDGNIDGNVSNSDDAKIDTNASDGDNNVDSSLNHPQSNKVYKFTSSDGDITIN